MSKEEKDAVNAAIDFLDSEAGKGFEGMNAAEFAIPFLTILHTTAPEINPYDSVAYVDGALPGHFFNTVSRKTYGPSVDVIVLRAPELVWLEWTPAGKLAGRHAPESIRLVGDAFSKRFREDNGNEVVEAMVYYVLLANDISAGPIVFTLKKTGLKYGKLWNSALRNTVLPSGKPCPIYGGVWRLSTVLNRNAANQTWYQIGIGKTCNAVFQRFINPEDFAKVKDGQTLLLDTKRIDDSFAALTEDAGKTSTDY